MIYLRNFYKVVTADMISLHRNEYHLEYSLNKWIYPKIGKIFVFADKKEAMRYGYEEYLRYDCLVINPSEILSRLSVLQLNNTCLTNFWLNRKGGHYKCPNSTYVVDAVKLVKRID